MTEQLILRKNELGYVRCKDCLLSEIIEGTEHRYCKCSHGSRKRFNKIYGYGNWRKCTGFEEDVGLW